MLSQIRNFIAAHPLTRDRQTAAWLRVLRYQLATRTRRRTTLRWFGGARLVVERNMAGASGNIYCGLHEPADMALLMHALRPGDLFVDVGANIGSFTVLASAVCKAQTIAFEPHPATAARLRRNLAANGIDHLVEVHELALTDHAGELRFTDGEDSMNHIAAEGSRSVRCDRLDHVLGGRVPSLIKIDVEGAEVGVLRGAAETLGRPQLEAVEVELWTPEVAALLTAAGLEIAYYDPVLRELTREPGAVRGSNALYVRDLDRLQARLRQAPKRQVLPGVLV